MNKTVLIVIGVVVLAAIGYYLVTNKGAGPTSNSNSSATEQTSTTNTNSVTQTPPKSLKELAASGMALTCSIHQTTGSAQSNGTIYMANSKMRGDFTSVSSGQSVASHIIVDGDTLYAWTDLLPYGFKMSASANPASGAQANQGVDINKQGNYDCSAWTAPDTSVFNVPTNIQFRSSAGS